MVWGLWEETQGPEQEPFSWAWLELVQEVAPSVALGPLEEEGPVPLEGQEAQKGLTPLGLEEPWEEQKEVQLAVEAAETVEQGQEHQWEAVESGLGVLLGPWPQPSDASPIVQVQSAIHHPSPLDHHHQSGLGICGH